MNGGLNRIAAVNNIVVLLSCKNVAEIAGKSKISIFLYFESPPIAFYLKLIPYYVNVSSHSSLTFNSEHFGIPLRDVSTKPMVHFAWRPEWNGHCL